MNSSDNDIGKLYGFEHEKLVQVQSLLTDSFGKVQGIMQKYSDPMYKEIVAELGSEFGSFQQAITQALSAQMPQMQSDPFEQLNALQVERQQGYDKLNELNDEIQRLQDQKAGANRLIEELQSQVKTNRISMVSETNDDDPPYSNPLGFDDSQSEIQALNSVIEQLRIENGSLKEENKLQIAKIEDLKRKIEAKGGQAKHLFRTDTVTDWNTDDLDSLKAEMNKQKLALMMNRQMNLNTSEEHNAAAQMSSINEDGTENDYENGDVNGSSMNGGGASMNGYDDGIEKGVYRKDTVTEWNQSELEKLKNELMDHLQEENRKAISQQIDRHMRFPEDKKPTNLLIGSDSGAMSIDELAERQLAMKEELAAQNRRIIMEKTEKAFQLRESTVNQGMLRLDDLDEAQQRLVEMNKRQAKDLLRKQIQKQDALIAPVVEPTPEQYLELDTFLKNVLGVLNENVRQSTVNELRSLFVDKSSSNGNGDGTRGSQPQSEVGTPYGSKQTTNAFVNSLLDEETDDIEVLYPTPGGPTPGGPTPGGPDDNELLGGAGVTAGGGGAGAVVGGMLESGGPSKNEWSRISEDQNKRINELTLEVSDKTKEINELRIAIGTLESDIQILKEENRENQNQSNNEHINNNNNSNNNEYGDGRLNIDITNKKELKQLQIQINDLKDAKLKLIRSTAKEMDHLRNMIRDMQKRITGEF